VTEPRKPRYAGFVILAALVFGLLVTLVSPSEEFRIEGTILLVLGGLLAWAILAAVRKRQRDAESNGRLAALEYQMGTRLRKLEEEVARLAVAIAARPASAAGEKMAPPAERPPAEPLPAAPPPAPQTIPQASVPPPSVAYRPPSMTVSQEPVSPAAPPPPSPPPPPPPAQLRPLMAPATAPGEAPAARAARMQLPDIEEMLGTNWLSKLGITVLVLGVAFFLVWQVATFGPAGKVAVGYLSGLALLGAGIYFERMERYRLLARVGIAGGWPLLFFVTYAMCHVPATHIAGVTVGVDLVLMLVVAGVMVAHTLRYRSQMVTGLALLLAFLTLAVNRESGAWSLTAAVVLALAVSILAVRMEWHELEVFGILATYLNHFYWLLPIIEPMGRPLRPFPEFLPSIICLLLYWAVFRASYVLRAPPADERVSSTAALLNTFLLLALAKYQSVYPQLAWKFLLALGAAEFVLGQLPIARRRRAAFLLLTTLGVTLIFTALPLHFSPENTSLLWLALSEALFFCGIFLDEIVFRRLAFLASAATAMQLLGVHAARVAGERMDGATYASHWPLGLTCAAAALAFFFTAHAAPRCWPQFFRARWDDFAVQAISALAAAVAFAGLYVSLPYAWVAVAWMALAVLLLGAAQRFKELRLMPEACVIAAAALLRVVLVNLHLTTPVAGGETRISLRLATLAAVGLLCYAGARWGEAKERAWSVHLPAALAWSGSGVLMLLAWYELRPASVALGWALLGAALLESGLAKRWLALRLQAYALFVSGFFRIFFVNLNAEGGAGLLTARIYTVAPLAVMLYFVYERLQGRSDEYLEVDRRLRAAPAHSWMGLLAAVALLRFEVPLDWVVAAWAALAVLLLVIAFASRRRLFISQGLIAGLAVAVRGVLHNFYERSYFDLPAPPLFGRYLVLSTTAAILLAGLPVAFRLRQRGAKAPAGGRLRRGWFHFANRPEQTLFFVALLLVTALLAAELRRSMVTMAWGLEAVAVFLFALKVGERSYRLAGLGLLLLCVAKLTVLDVWDMVLRDKAITFMVLGASLVGVSILYTRHRAIIRRYL
jgi:uncharacterized membrane protein